MKYKSGRKTNSGWKLKAAARYLQTVGTATSREILSNARSKVKQKHIGLSTQQLAMRMRVHPSFESTKVYPQQEKSVVMWRLRNEDILKDRRER